MKNSIKERAKKVPQEIKDKVANQRMAGDVAIVNLPVKVLFEWSNQIAVEWDEEGNVLEYDSGFVMKVLPDQGFVYQGQENKYLYSTYKEK